LFEKEAPYGRKTDRVEFKEWFRGSKVVDAKGEPLVVYHGTKGALIGNTFSPDLLGSTTLANSAKEGFFFSSSPKIAGKYADIASPEHARYTQEQWLEKKKEVRHEIFRNRDLMRDMPGIIVPSKPWEQYEMESDAPLETREAFKNYSQAKAEQKLILGLYDEAAPGLSKEASGQTIYPVYLKIENPLIVDLGSLGYEKEFYTDIMKRAKREGHDGVFIQSEEPIEYVAFSPTQIKSVYNRGTFSPTDANILREPDATYGQQPTVPWYYSKVSRVIDEKMPARASAEQIKGILSPQNGIKADELKWLGLDDYLSQPGPFTKEDVQRFLGLNQVRVTETVLGATAPKLTPKEYAKFVDLLKDADNLGFEWTREAKNAIFENADWVQRWDVSDFPELIELGNKYRKAWETNSAQPKFSQWQMKGEKTNYREVLVTLPVKTIDITKERLNKIAMREYGKRYDALTGTELMRIDKLAGRGPMYQDLASYRSPHFPDTPNIIIHMRMNDRILPDGRKGLMWEEVQAEVQQRIREIQEDLEEGADAGERTLADFEIKQKEEELARLQALPFGGSNQRYELAAKWMLRHAAEGGYDVLLWTPGKVQQERYSLANQAEAVRLTRDGALYVIPKGRKEYERVASDVTTEKKLGRQIGKALAAKLFHAKHAPGKDREITGVELEVKGEWAINLYDKQLPNILNKLGKKWGAKVGEVGFSVPRPAQIKVEGEWHAIRGLRTWLSNNRIDEASLEIGQRLPGFGKIQDMVGGSRPVTVHALDLTPALKDSVLTDGQALFERKNPYGLRGQQELFPLRPDANREESATLARAAIGALDQAGEGVSTLQGNIPTRITPAQETRRGVDAGRGVRTLGDALSHALIHDGVVNLRGQKATTAEDFAQLFQVYRNPEFETLRIVLTKGDTIVHHQGFTSRLPNTVKFVQDDAHFQELANETKDLMAEFGADGWSMQHNHPSGKPTPSEEDAALTARFIKAVPGFKLHIVIDSGAYGLMELTADGKSIEATVHDLDTSATDKLLFEPSIPHDFLKQHIRGQQDTVIFGKRLQTPNEFIGVFYLSGKGTIRAIQEIPVNLFKATKEVTVYLREQAGHFGGASIVAFSTRNDVMMAGDELVRSGVLTDVVFGSARESSMVRTQDDSLGRVMPNRSTAYKGLTMAEVPIERVAEKAAPYSRGQEHMGNLSKSQQAALRNVHGAPKTWAGQLETFTQGWKDKLAQGLFDSFAPIMDYSKKGYILARLTKGGSGTLEALLMYGKPYVDQDGAYRVDHKEADGPSGFAKVLSALNGEHDRFFDWVAAQRAGNLKKVGLENLYSEMDIVTLKTLNQGTMKDGTPRGAPYELALMEYNEWNAAILKIAVDSKLIDQSTMDLYKNLPHVPFYRLHEEDIVSPSGMKAGIVNQYAWKKLKGGTEKLNQDLLANVLLNWSHLITASAKNRAAKVTLEAAVEAGVAEEVPSGRSEAGLVSFRDDVTRLIPEGQRYMEGGVEKISDGTAEILYNAERKFRVTDPALMDAIGALHYAGLGPIAKPFTTAKRWLTFGVTVNPAFKIRNLIRDSIASIATSELSYNPVANIAQGLRALAPEKDTRAQVLAGGGMIRFGAMLDGNNADRTRRLIERGVDPDLILDDAGKITRFFKQRILPVFEAYQEFGDRGEQANRVALYEQLRAKKVSHLEASFWARDLLDFSMQGKWGAVRILTGIVPFMNARLQGLYKLQGGTTRGILAGRATEKEYTRLATVMGAVSLASMALLLAYQDDEDWKKREDWDRDNYWWFKIGDTAVRLPKPFEIGAVGTLAERSLELMVSDEMTGERFRERIAATVLHQLQMNPTPQLFKPMVDLYANRNSFTGRPIETMGMKNLQKADRVTARTSEVARLLGQLGLPDPSKVFTEYEALSPVQIDSLIKGYFAWMGVATTTALDYGIRPLMDRGAKPSMKLRDVFFAGNFIETLPSGSSRYVTEFYDQAQEIEQAYASWRDAMKYGDTERGERLLESERARIEQQPGIALTRRRQSHINAQIKMIERNLGMSSAEKRKKIDELRERRHGIAKELSDMSLAAGVR